MKIEQSFFLKDDVVDIARELLGKVIHTRIQGKHVSGLITETEAYAGVEDRASHAYGGRYTSRTSTLYLEGGIAYVYLCYGVHCLFNFVTNKAGIPQAVLLRGIVPLKGIGDMEKRRGKTYADRGFVDGPGKLSQGLGISMEHNGIDLQGDTIWVEDGQHDVQVDWISEGPRIGVDYAGRDAMLPYRFLLAPRGWAKKNLP